ncbi:hypothetical protein BY996DRAFT_6471008 [Phakopsora pachyrhizi]|nr:hypothetical protein BY996DRAFT_6471008 [Phakopsora pachyrhizi]
MSRRIRAEPQHDLKRNQAYRDTGYRVKGRTSNKDEDLRRRLLEFKTEFEKIQEDNEQRIKGSVKEKELLIELNATAAADEEEEGNWLNQQVFLVVVAG